MRLQGEGAPPSGGALTKVVGSTYMAGKIKFQIWHLFVLVAKFDFFFVLNLVYLYIKLRSVKLFLKFSKFVT